MKILHLYKDYYPQIGGIENHLKTLAESQVSDGHDVTVLVCSREGEVAEEQLLNGVRVIKANRLVTAASMPISVSQPWLLSRFGPDIVHIQSPYPLAELANQLIGRGRATIISYQSDIVRQQTLLHVYGPILRRILAKADRIIVSSNRYLRTSSWLEPVHIKCTVIPIGVDLSRFLPPRVRQKDIPEILFVGRLAYYKGLDTLIRALQLIPEARLTVVGEGPFRSEWVSLSEQLQVAQRIEFRGQVSEAELPELYRNADVFVLPSNVRSEAFGIVLVEAMASSLPCITTEIGSGNSWIVQDGITGLVVSPNNPEELAGALTKLLKDPDLRDQMGAAGRNRAEKHFNLTQMVSSIEKVYDEVLSARGR